MTLQDALAPTSSEAFVETHLSKQYLLLQDRPRRFSALVQWAEVNLALQRLRCSGNRCRLIQNGKEFSQGEYLTAPRKTPEKLWIDARKLERRLADGATLVINQVDELLDNVRTMTESCEDLVRCSVGVNLYAGWRTDQGFGIHWDDHDTLIAQVSGRKKWRVFEPTGMHPIMGHPRVDQPQPSGQPIWEGVLEDGDLLYMPKGWWHVACPLDEPTLHLTFGWKTPTALDVLEWLLAGNLTDAIGLRRDVPHLRDASVQAAYVADMRQDIVGALTDDVVEKFMRAVDDKMPVRPRIALPEAATLNRPGLGLDSRLRLAVGTRLHIDAQPGESLVTFVVDGHEWTCAAALIPALRLLRATRPTTLGEMRSAIEAEGKVALQAFTAALMDAGILWIERTTDGQPEANVQDTAAHEPSALR